MRFISFLFLVSCAVSTVQVPKEYIAAIDIGCLLFGIQNGSEPVERKMITARCSERLVETYIRMKKESGQ